MIYFVDEDVSAFGAWIWELERNSFSVTAIRNADDALERLSQVSSDDVELVIIDVMLAVADPNNTRYDSERTYEYLETGLRLLEDLCDENPKVFPRSAVLLTNTANPSTLDAAMVLSERLAVPLWQKATMYSPVAFLDRVKRHLALPADRA